MATVELNEWKAWAVLYASIAAVALSIVAATAGYWMLVGKWDRDVQVESAKAGLVQRVVIVQQGWGSPPQSQVVWTTPDTTPDKLAVNIAKP